VLQWSLFAKELRENRVIFFLLLCVFLASAILIPLSFGPHRDLVNQVELSRYIGHQTLATGRYSNYAWNRWLAGNLTWMAAVAAVIFGAGAVSGEIAGGTALFLATRPVTRREIYTTKAAAGLTLLAVCVFGSTLALALTSSLKGYLMDFGLFMMAVLITFAGAAVVYLSTAALSVVLSSPGKTILGAGLIWTLLSAPGFIVPAAEPFSMIYQMKAVPYWIYGQNPIVPLGLFLVLIGIVYELGVWLWSSREL
jgi:ABC-type transport system involved in multi-copper enzyme maturation permease subunit